MHPALRTVGQHSRLLYGCKGAQRARGIVRENGSGHIVRLASVIPMPRPPRSVTLTRAPRSSALQRCITSNATAVVVAESGGSTSQARGRRQRRDYAVLAAVLAGHSAGCQDFAHSGQPVAALSGTVSRDSGWTAQGRISGVALKSGTIGKIRPGLKDAKRWRRCRTSQARAGLPSRVQGL